MLSDESVGGPVPIGTMQFASLDATALDSSADLPSSFNKPPSANALARRSISIFSRRGTETPEPRPPFIEQAAAEVPLKRRTMTEKQRQWMRRTSGGFKKKKRCTVLNAVPETPLIQMTPLETEMATSPNEEIVAALGPDASPVQLARANSVQHTPVQQFSFWSASPSSPTQRSKSQKRRDPQSRIGVWVDGVVQWEECVRPRTAERSTSVRSQMIGEETGMTTVKSIPSKASKMLGLDKPLLSVIIPKTEPLVNDTTISRIVQPAPQRPVLPVAPPSFMSRYFGSTPTVDLKSAASDISPLEPSPLANEELPPALPTRPSPVGKGETTPALPPRPQNFRESSSSSSSAADRDDRFSHSKRSSATSIFTLTLKSPEDAPAVEESKSATAVVDSGTFSINGTGRKLDKPLPPVPNQRSSALFLTLPPPTPSASSKRQKARPKSTRSVKSAPGGRKSRKVKMQNPRTTRALSQIDAFDLAFMRTSPYATSSVSSPAVSEDETDIESPTISEIETEIHTQLSDMQEGKAPAARRQRKSPPPSLPVSRTSTVTSHVKRNESVRSVMQPPERAPTLPKRSRKRDWRRSAQLHTTVQIPAALTLPQRRKSESNLKQPKFADKELPPVPTLRRRSTLCNVHQFARHIRFISDGSSAYLPLPSPHVFQFDDGLCVVAGPTIVISPLKEVAEEQAIATDDEDARIAAESAKAAEGVLLRILESLQTLDDLENTSVINKGMRRVYKEHEMHLIRSICFNQSPAAWELREWCPPERRETQSSKASSQLEHTPKTFIRCYRRDMKAIEQLKALILVRCQTFIRHETALALAAPDHPFAQRFNDAFWRIWCFCKIFGCGKEREEDVTGQLDWLKGGILANNQGFSATVNTNLDYDMDSVLLNPPDHFAKGNAGGLSEQQLYDMMELWTCLAALLSQYHTQTKEAAKHGIFAVCDVTDGDIAKQESTLEEWIAYLLTLGPAVVLEMAQHPAGNTASGFAHAQAQGWTKWTQALSTRTTFLKEPVSRLYEERVAAASTSGRNFRQQEKKENSRKRVASLAAEIRLRRQTSSYHRQPYITMSDERPMSLFSRANSTRSTFSAHTTLPPSPQPYRHQQYQHPAPIQRVSSPSTVPRVGSPLGISPLQSSIGSVSHPPTLSPLSANSAIVTTTIHTSGHRNASGGQWSPRRISPIIEDRVETFNRIAMQSFNGDANDTADRAVRKIVDMGFTTDQAKEALRITDMGDGLRVDRAVDLLLRQRCT